MVVLLVLAGVIVLVVALVAVGRETFSGRERPRQALFDLEEAVDWVADHLPFEVSAKLSYDDVRTIVGWHLDDLARAGVSGTRAPKPLAEVVIVGDDDVQAELAERARAAGLDADRADVVAVLDAARGYLRAIGAIGPEAPDV